MKHSESIKSSALWKTYEAKVKQENNAEDRIAWVLKVFKTAESHLKDVRITFPNYTLHDGVHILNVVDSIGGLLGNQINKLSAYEAELLILCAALHDIGMIYTEEQKYNVFNNPEYADLFESLYNISMEDCSEDMKQNFLRYLHPYRIDEVLSSNAEWKKLFNNKADSSIPKSAVIEVCKSHGYSTEEVKTCPQLEYLQFNKVDLRFCSFILRLADLLDFDDTRTPMVLFNCKELNIRSEEEWRKHISSEGFAYPTEPSTNELPFKAECLDPNIEELIRTFLSYIDKELLECIMFQPCFHEDWQRNFPFPRAISKQQIIPKGYENTPFRITMDQQQILNLFTGERLYSKNTAFIRELLQNSVDAILLRNEIDSQFSLANAKIEIWDWFDSNGKHWFRIDDNGTGMTKYIINNHLLKVGDSYYTSKDLENDWYKYKRSRKNIFRGISQFGIGFLACFLCCNNIEISTKYFDSGKEPVASIIPRRNGLRLSVKGLSGLYTLRSEARGHECIPMPTHPSLDDESSYRSSPGTSILLEIDNTKAGTFNLSKVINEYICGTEMQVYLNGERIGLTKKEFQTSVLSLNGYRRYNIVSNEVFESFAKTFGDATKKNLLRINLKEKPFTTLLHKEDAFNNEIFGVASSININRLDFDYVIKKGVSIHYEGDLVNTVDGWYLVWNPTKQNDNTIIWNTFIEEYGSQYAGYLSSLFEECNQPIPADQLNQILSDNRFSYENHKFIEEVENEPQYLKKLWISYVYSTSKPYELKIDDEDFLNYLSLMMEDRDYGCIRVYYNGVLAGLITTYSVLSAGTKNIVNCIVLLDGENIPTINVARDQVRCLPLEIVLKIFISLSLNNSGVIEPRKMSTGSGFDAQYYFNVWRSVLSSDYGRYLSSQINNSMVTLAASFNDPLTRNNFRIYRHGFNAERFYTNLVYSYFQMNYEMLVDFASMQKITFSPIKSSVESFNWFYAGFLFCHSNSDDDKKFLCAANVDERFCFNMDHAFMIWLIENSSNLFSYFRYHYTSILDKLLDGTEKEIIQSVNQLYDFSRNIPKSEWHDVQFGSLKRISKKDFWR